ncbi:hypothetical protein BH10ACT8_BH10ACT8_10820 [soil metagenome]
MADDRTSPWRAFASSTLLCAALVLPLAACGGTSSTAAGKAASPPAGSGSAITGQAGSGQAGSSSDAGGTASGGASRAGSIDVCALLSPEDAAAVARQLGLNGAQTAATKYSLSTKKVVNTNPSFPMSSCEFSIDGEGASGTVVIQVMSADNFSLYASGGTKVSGLGDEAYDQGNSTVVRVGALMLQTSENSFGNDFVVALYQKMIPKLR